MNSENPSAEDRDLLFSVVESLKVYTAPAMCTIIGGDEVDYGILIGSGIFVTDTDGVFILTAGHVPKEAFKFKYPSHSTGDAHRPVLIQAAPFILDDPSDLAAIPVEVESLDSASKVPFDVSIFAETSDNLDNDILFIQGYPQKDSRFSALANGIYSKSQPYGTFECSSTLSIFNPSIHFAIQYSPQAQEDIQGNAAYLPPPHGMSGTPVWKSNRKEKGENWKPSDARIVGVVHTWDKDGGCLIVTRVEVVRYFFQHRKVSKTTD